MEESEKRRERLRAMQREAAQQPQHRDPTASPPPSSSLLAPPRLDDPSTGMADRTPSFDFYTDPLAAFSGARRKPVARPSHSPDMPEPMPPRLGFHPPPQYPGYRISAASSNSPGFQPPPQYPPYQQHQASPVSSNGPGGSAMRPPWPGFPAQRQVSPSGFSSPSFAGQPMWQPNFISPPSPGGPPHRSPGSGMQNSSFQTPGGFPARPSDGCAMFMPSPRNLGLGFRESGHGQSGGSSRGRGSPWFEQNRSPSGKGSPWEDSSPSSERSMLRSSGGRGQRFARSTPVSARDQPELFYKKSMMEDPWKNLVPKPYPIHAKDSWLPKSISAKKLKSADSKLRTSGLSLADSLENAFAAAVADNNDLERE